MEEKELAIAYKVAGFEFYYEPIYVARADTPPFDEMFVGYGMTRNTQVRMRKIKMIMMNVSGQR